MNIEKMVKHGAHLISENAPTILTALGVVGVVGTAISSAQAAINSRDAIQRVLDSDEGDMHYGTALSARKKVETTWRYFLPPLALGGATIACVIGANTVSTRRTAALASAFALSEKAFGDYKEKAGELLGKNKEQKVFDEIAEKRVRENDEAVKTVIVAGSKDVLCYDVYSDRYFSSSAEKIRRAANNINAQCINHMYASHNEFYQEIGVPGIPAGETVGWTTDNMLDLRFTSMLDDDEPILAVNYVSAPKANFHKVW